MMSATGIVIAIVKTPHGLLASACTTTSASTASRMTMIESTLMSASAPIVLPISSFTIWPSVLPRRRTEAKRTIMSCDATAQRRPDQDPQGAGQVAELRRQHRPDERPGPRDRSEVMTERHPAIGRDEISAVIHDQRGRGALVIQHEHLGREPLAVETVTDRHSRKGRRSRSRGR